LAGAIRIALEFARAHAGPADVYKRYRAGTPARYFNSLRQDPRFEVRPLLVTLDRVPSNSIQK
jgi:hypothetical protein